MGLFANDKKNADVLLENVESLLRERHGVTSFGWFRKEASSRARVTEEFIAECDVVDAARHRRDYRSGRDAVPNPEGGGAQACENRAPAVHTATQPFLEERE